MKNYLPTTVLAVFFSTFVFQCFGQGLSWAQGFNCGIGIAAIDHNNNIYSLGSFSNAIDVDHGPGVYSLTPVGNYDWFVLKENSSGTFQWAVHFDGSPSVNGFISIRGITTDNDSNVYISGGFTDSFDFDPGPGVSYMTTAPTNSHAFILKLNASGNLVWAKQIGGTTGGGGIQNIKVDAYGSIYLIGAFSGTIDADPGTAIFNISSTTISDLLIEKLDTAGNFKWVKQIGGAGCLSFAIDTLANMYFTGPFKNTVDFDPSLGVANLSAAGMDDIYVEKLDSAGNYQWVKSVGGNSSDIAQGIAVDSFGNVLITGYFNGTVDFDPGPGVSNLISNSRDIFTLRLRNNGDFSWARSVNSTPGNDDGRAIATDVQGNVYTVAELLNPADVDPGSGVFTVGGHFVQKLDSSGNFAWATTLGGLPGWVGLDGNNSVYVTGAFSGTNVDFDPGPAVYPVSGSGYIEKFCVSQPFTIVSDKTAMCSGDTAHLSTASQPGATYYWLNGGTVLPGSNNDTLNATATGSYSVYVYGSGCPSGSDTVSLTVTPSVHPSITINAPASAIAGQQVVVTATLTNAGTGYSINWYNKGIYQGTTATPSFSYTKQQGNDTITAEIINSANPCYYPDTSNAEIVTVIDGIADVMTSLGLSIYPNPFADIITIKGLKQKDIITLSDISGRIIEAHATTGDVLTMQTDHLAAGYYILKIADEKGVKVNVPVVKR